MSDQQRTPRPEDEQQEPYHSPIEEEIRENEPGTPAPRDVFTIFGYSLGVVVAAVFILFIVAVVVALLVS